jgi:PhnB protein
MPSSAAAVKFHAEVEMNEPRKAVPDGASGVIPRLFCRHPADEVEFCVATFQAEERVRRPGPDGTLAHALIMISTAMVMIEAEWPDVPNRAPGSGGATPVALYVYVENVDETVERAVSHGARVLMPPANQPWGDRIAWFIDPAGHVWTAASRIEETTEQQRNERLGTLMQDSTSPGT